MGEGTHISWADHTFNPWIGCTEVSVGPQGACVGCYAREMAKFRGWAEWGNHPRQRTTASNWRQPVKWNKAAGASGERPFVFCSSLADVFDNQVPVEWRRDLFDLIWSTTHLTWLLLTKRPQNIQRLFAEAYPELSYPEKYWPKNAAIGCTVVTQEEADRDVPVLLRGKAALNPAFAFLSMEPLMGAVDLTNLDCGARQSGAHGWSALWPLCDRPAIDWVITGGETDQGEHKARPSHPDWFRDLRDQCAAAGVAYHHKQNGEWAPGECSDRPQLRSQDAAWWFDDRWDFGRLTPSEAAEMHTDDEPAVWRLGKKDAGRFLDGAVHDDRPQIAA